MSDKVPDLRMVKGLIATILGIIFVVVVHRIVISLLFFVAGILLLYYGLTLLNISSINSIFATIKNYFNKFLS